MSFRKHVEPQPSALNQNLGPHAHAVFSGSGDGQIPFPQHYRYYDSPGDKDLAKKIAYTAPYVCAGFALVGLHDVSLLNKPKNAAGYVGRMLFWTVPPIGLTAAFCTGTFVATRALKKDSPLSHFWGGAAAGWFVGAWNRSVLTGVCSAVGLGIMAMIKKHCVEEGIELIPEIARSVGSVRSPTNGDYSWFPDNRPRGWTSDPNEV